MNADPGCLNNEGREFGAPDAERMASSSGRVLHTAGTDLPYMVVLTRPQGFALHQSFRTMREAEAFIRRNTPAPVRALSTLYDRPADKT